MQQEEEDRIAQLGADLDDWLIVQRFHALLARSISAVVLFLMFGVVGYCLIGFAPLLIDKLITLIPAF
jgi:hypothetical protein